MTGAAASVCPRCRELGRHHRLCPEWAPADARAQAKVRRADQIREDRAAGRKSVPSAAWALRWYANTRASWASARGLPLDPEREGTGAPNRGMESPKRRLFAAVAWAIHLAEKDDRERHTTKPAPLLRWLLQHFGAGRAYAWMAEETATWSEVEVAQRVERALRIVRDRLRERDILDSGGRDDG